MKLAIVIFIVSTALSLGECITCYSCKNDSLSTQEEHRICGEQFIREEMNTCNGTYCLKIVATSTNGTYSESNVRRLCTDSLNNAGHIDKYTNNTVIPNHRSRRSMHTEYATFYYCDFNFCNSGTNLSIFISLLSLSFINLIL